MLFLLPDYKGGILMCGCAAGELLSEHHSWMRARLSAIPASLAVYIYSIEWLKKERRI